MELLVKLVILTTALVALSDAVFVPRCLWQDILQEMNSSEESMEHWIWGSSFGSESGSSRGSRVRRFLWKDRDVCELMCGSNLRALRGIGAVEGICRRCCPKTTKRPASATTPSSATPTDGTSRVPRSTVRDEATTGTSGSTSPTDASSTATSSTGLPPSINDAPVPAAA